MTEAEGQLIQAAHPELTLHRHPDPRFVYLKAQPCPLLRMEGKKAVCTIYAIRPYSCRRFGCFRPDPSTEPYEREMVDLETARLGCANLSDRLTNRKVRKAYALLQRKAQRWARAHGWSEDMTGGPPTGSDVRIHYLTPV